MPDNALIEHWIDKVRQWGKDKGITDSGTPIAQAAKTIEESSELLSAVNVQDKAEIKDAIGDVMVTIILQAEMQDMDIHDCLRHAYQQIAHREGRMINGQFVKET